MLTIKNNKINNNNKEIILKGINIGGWLMMEGYMLGGRNIAESAFKSSLAQKYGKNYINKFSKKFRENYFSKEDYKKIKDFGFNCVRLPFNYRLLKEKDGFSYLKKVVDNFAKNKLYVILDMHSVPGSQNDQWHSDSDGVARLWEEEKHKKEYIQLWKKLANIFKNNKWIAGYDIMNEPVTKKIKEVKKLYQKTIEAIRNEGDRHIIFLEGNNWGMDLDFLDKMQGDNLALSAHYYQPVEFSFNWMPDTKYPGTILGKKWNKTAIRKILKHYHDLSKKLGYPVLIGEFGVASRCICCAKEFKWLEDVFSVFKEFGFHWTYWTYKSVRGMKVPDGLMQLTDGTGIIGNEATSSGMDHFVDIIGKREKEFYEIWKTGNYRANEKLEKIIKKYISTP